MSTTADEAPAALERQPGRERGRDDVTGAGAGDLSTPTVPGVLRAASKSPAPCRAGSPCRLLFPRTVPRASRSTTYSVARYLVKSLIHSVSMCGLLLCALDIHWGTRQKGLLPSWILHSSGGRVARFSKQKYRMPSLLEFQIRNTISV